MCLLLSVVFIVIQTWGLWPAAAAWDQPVGVRLPHIYLPTSNLPACRFKCPGLRTCLKEEGSLPSARRVAHVLVVQKSSGERGPELGRAE